MQDVTSLSEPQAVLQQSSTTTPPRVLSQGMTEQEWEIFYKLLINLFVEKPGQKQPGQKGMKDASVTTQTRAKRAGNRTSPQN